jgi:hypothetical protein
VEFGFDQPVVISHVDISTLNIKLSHLCDQVGVCASGAWGGSLFRNKKVILRAGRLRSKLRPAKDARTTMARGFLCGEL